MAHPLPVIANAHLITQKLDMLAHERATMEVVHCVIDTSAGNNFAAIADNYADAFVAQLLALCNSNLTLGQTLVLPLDGSTPTQVFSTDQFGAAGGHVSALAQPNVMAFVIRWGTGRRGKSYRGRTFLPGVTQDRLVDSFTAPLSAASQTAVTNAANGFLLALQNSVNPPLALQILSRKLGTVRAVTGGVSAPNVGIQRRRYEKVARH